MSEDYAAMKTEEVLSRYDKATLTIPHQARLQAAIRQAILEAMRDQRYAGAEAVLSLPCSLLSDVLVNRVDAVQAIQDATVKPQEKR